MRTANAFRTEKERQQYWLILSVLLIVSLIFTVGLLVYNNPVPVGSPSFIPVVKRRLTSIITMMIVAVSQSLSTVTFQSVTGNKIITPSLLGFDAIYAMIQTSLIFVLGANALINFQGLGVFVLQVIIMVVFSLILYGWLLSGKNWNLQLMLLVGVIIGTGFRTLSTFMRRLLSPTEFDILQAKLFGSVNHANSSYFVVAIPVVIVIAGLLFLNHRKLNVLALGKDVSTSLGLNPQRYVIYSLLLVSILMAISTALIGSITFYGFLVALLAYQLAPTYDHKYTFMMALVLGYIVLTGAYFLMINVFDAQGVVSIIIEIIGGLTFLVVLLRKGTV